MFALGMLLAVLVCPMHLLGQNGENLTGSVEGTGGAVLAGVKVTLVREETQAKQEIATAKDGSFAFTDLALGNYLLAIEATDFEPYSSILQVGTGGLSPLVIKLKLRTVAQNLTVKAYSNDERLSPESNTNSMDMNETALEGLPLETDYLQPFVETFLSPAAEGNEGASIVVDGVEGGALDMPTAAIRRLKIDRNPYSVKFQHPGAARAEITTEHGHYDRYEGSIAFYARNSIFDARNALADSNPNLNRRFVEASLGGSLPGREGSFFFAGQRLMDDESAVVSSLDTVALTGTLNINVPNPRRNDHLFLRTHWSLTDTQWLSLNYVFTDKSTRNKSVGGLTLPEQGFSEGRQTQRAQLEYSQALSPQLFNDLIFLFKKEDARTGDPATGPEILVNGAFTGGPSQIFEGTHRRGFD
ncbi:MAG: hypothetical protein DMG32_27465, partial [Acidobacteria bacterium]